MKLALRLAKDCHKAYQQASPGVRRLWNDAFFESIVVRERKVHRVVYREPFRSLCLLPGVRSKGLGGGGRESNPPDGGCPSHWF